MIGKSLAFNQCLLLETVDDEVNSRLLRRSNEQNVANIFPKWPFEVKFLRQHDSIKVLRQLVDLRWISRSQKRPQLTKVSQMWSVVVLLHVRKDKKCESIIIPVFQPGK